MVPPKINKQKNGKLNPGVGKEVERGGNNISWFEANYPCSPVKPRNHLILKPNNELYNRDQGGFFQYS